MPSGPPDAHEFDAELEQLRREFVAGLPGQAAALDAALQLGAAAPAEAAAAIRRLAHRLRGAGGSYGFPDLTAAAAAVEEGPPDELEARARKLADLVRETARRGLEPQGPGAGDTAASAAAQAARAAILIVEDDAATGRLLEASLQAPDRELVLAQTGAEANGLVHQREFAIILLDLHLPDGDGRRLLAEWRLGPARNASIFVLSADLGHQIKAECLVAGADAFFDKPIRREVIVAAVQSRLQRLSESPPPTPRRAPAVPEPLPPPPAREGQQVALVVEDDPFVGTMVRHRLSRAGFAVRHAADGAKGLAASAAERPDLVVLDLNLPELNGFQLLERLRADPATHQVPVLILTASGAEKDLVRAFALGADDYLVKPFSPTELLARVQRLAAGGRGAGPRAS